MGEQINVWLAEIPACTCRVHMGDCPIHDEGDRRMSEDVIAERDRYRAALEEIAGPPDRPFLGFDGKLAARALREREPKPAPRLWVLSGWHEGSPGTGAVYVDGPVLRPGESVTVTEKEARRLRPQGEALGIEHPTVALEQKIVAVEDGKAVDA